VLDTLEHDQLLANAETVGAHLHRRLAEGLANVDGVTEVRGWGLMLGIELDRPCGVLVTRALEAGLLINVTRDRVVRLLPPLILTSDQADHLAEILIPLIKQFLAE